MQVVYLQLLMEHDSHHGLILILRHCSFSWKLNCRQILGEYSEKFRFCHLINYLLTGLLLPYHELLSPRFYARTSQARSVLQNLGLSISRYGPCIRLINSKYYANSILLYSSSHKILGSRGNLFRNFFNNWKP